MRTARIARAPSTSCSASHGSSRSGGAALPDSRAEEQAPCAGVVNGKVLVYSPEGIVIEGDLVYAHEPPAEADDFLGLVSDKSVEIAPSDVTGPGDLSIHASIYAKRQFAVRGYRERHTGTLFIFGSVSAGSVTATEPRFATRIEFDDRLEDAARAELPVDGSLRARGLERRMARRRHAAAALPAD